VINAAQGKLLEFKRRGRVVELSQAPKQAIKPIGAKRPIVVSAALLKPPIKPTAAKRPIIVSAAQSKQAIKSTATSKPVDEHAASMKVVAGGSTDFLMTTESDVLESISDNVTVNVQDDESDQQTAFCGSEIPNITELFGNLNLTEDILESVAKKVNLYLYLSL
jgi:hypothetical protein